MVPEKDGSFSKGKAEVIAETMCPTFVRKGTGEGDKWCAGEDESREVGKHNLDWSTPGVAMRSAKTSGVAETVVDCRGAAGNEAISRGCAIRGANVSGAPYPPRSTQDVP